MKLSIPRPKRSHKTAFIDINTHLCEACWICIETCPNRVLGKVDILFHRHAHVEAAESCNGCLKCVGACPHGAIFSVVQKRQNQ